MTLRKIEKYLNILWSAIALGMAFFTIREVTLVPDPDLLVWFILHVMAAVLFLVRSRPIHFSSSITAYLVAIASVNYYLLFDFIPIADSTLYIFGKLVMLIGGIMCVISTLSLGRNFGILPISRGVSTNGAYRLIRHPIYLSYIVLDTGIVTAYASTANSVIFLIGIILFVIRIRYEEEVMGRSRKYREYRDKVKYKLIPYTYLVCC